MAVLYAVINFNVTLDGFDEIRRRLTSERVNEAVGAMVRGLAQLLLRYSQMGAPVETGNLRRAGFSMVAADNLSAIVGYGTKYAGVVEDGSRAHEISAKNAKTLHFVPQSFATLAQAQAASQASRLGGNVKKARSSQDVAIFPTHVFHPGTVANPFLAQGWEDAKPDAQDWLAQVGSRFVGGDPQVEP